MATVETYITVDINLAGGFETVQPFDVEAFILDSEAVPVDQRYRILSAEDDLSLLTDDSPEQRFATSYFAATAADGSHPDSLVLIRQVKTAIPPAFVCGSHETTLATWKAVTAGTLTFVDGAVSPHTVTVTAIDFSSITAITQVPTVLTAKLAGLTTPTIVDLDDAAFEVDALGRMVVKMPSTQDESDPTIQITFSATPGTVAYLLGVKTADDTTGGIVPGNAVETMLEAYNAAKVLTSFYNVAVETRFDDTTADIEEAIDLATQCEADKRQCSFISNDADAKDPVETGDLQYQLRLLDNGVAKIGYYLHEDEYPESASDGKFLAEEPGSSAYGGRKLAGMLKASGNVGSNYALSTTDRGALLAKGYNVYDRVGTTLICHPGKVASGKEARMVIAKHWLERNIQNDWWRYKTETAKAVLFDTVTLGVMDSIIRKHLNTLGPRDGEPSGFGVIESYTINLPKLSDWTAANKLANHIPFRNVFTATGTYEGHTFEITGNINM